MVALNQNKNSHTIKMAFLDGGPISVLIKICCLCILYVFLYIIYVLWRIISSFMWWGKRDVITIPFWWLFDRLTLILFILCLMLLPAAAIFFLILYFVWKVFWFFLRGISPFSDCNDLGVFDLIDRMFDILFGRDSVGIRIRRSFKALFDFSKRFMKEAFGVVFEGYELDEEYLNLALKAFLTEKVFPNEKERCKALKQDLMNLFAQKTPVVKLTYNENVKTAPRPSTMSEMDLINLNNCISRYTTQVPKDANTIERLKLIFFNEIAKKKCEFNVANGCPVGKGGSKDPACLIGEMENTLKSVTDDLGLSAVLKIGNKATAMSDNFQKQQKQIDSKIKKD